MAQAYCFRCRSRVDIEDPEVSLSITNKLLSKGRCPRCSATVLAISRVMDSQEVARMAGEPIEEPAATPIVS